MLPNISTRQKSNSLHCFWKGVPLWMEFPLNFDGKIMSCFRRRLEHRLPGKERVIAKLHDFCHQFGTGPNFSSNECDELFDWLAHQSDDEAAVFLEAFLEALKESDSDASALLRRVVPKRAKKPKVGLLNFLSFGWLEIS